MNAELDHMGAVASENCHCCAVVGVSLRAHPFIHLTFHVKMSLPTTGILAWWLLKKRFTVLNLLGSLLVVGGCLLVALPPFLEEYRCVLIHRVFGHKRLVRILACLVDSTAHPYAHLAMPPTSTDLNTLQPHQHYHGSCHDRRAKHNYDVTDCRFFRYLQGTARRCHVDMDCSVRVVSGSQWCHRCDPREHVRGCGRPRTHPCTFLVQPVYVVRLSYCRAADYASVPWRHGMFPPLAPRQLTVIHLVRTFTHSILYQQQREYGVSHDQTAQRG